MSDFSPGYAQLPSGVASPLQLDSNSNLKVTNAGSSTIASPTIIQNQIAAAIAAGQGYSALQALNIAAGTYPLALFNPSTAKNMLIYSCKIDTGSGGASCYLRIDTSNPAFGTTITPNNRRAGGAASASSCSATTTSQATPTNLLDQYNSGNLIHTFDFFNNGQMYLLPAGANNGLTAFITTFASGLSSLVFSWIEY